MKTFFNRYKFAVGYFIALTRQHFHKWHENKKIPVYTVRNKHTGFWEEVNFINFYIMTLNPIIKKIY